MCAFENLCKTYKLQYFRLDVKGDICEQHTDHLINLDKMFKNHL